jgi:hypothetical protein
LYTQVAPQAKIMKVFDEQVRPLYKPIVESERESRTLAARATRAAQAHLRGELRVKHAEKLIEEAG